MIITEDLLLKAPVRFPRHQNLIRLSFGQTVLRKFALRLKRDKPKDPRMMRCKILHALTFHRVHSPHVSLLFTKQASAVFIRPLMNRCTTEPHPKRNVVVPSSGTTLFTQGATANRAGGLRSLVQVHSLGRAGIAIPFARGSG